jgi:hypothetical protein
LALPGDWESERLTRLRLVGSRRLRDITLETFGLVSKINSYTLVAWEGGRRIRRLSGWSDEVCADEGPPLAEEQAERAQFRPLSLDGVPHFEDKKSGERYSHDQVGENFVFAASRTRLFGE